MNWNPFNIAILLACIPIVTLAWYKLFQLRKNRTARYLNGFTIIAILVMVQVLLIDIGIAQKYPVIQLFYQPFQFLSPIFFTAFTFSYLDLWKVYKSYRFPLWIPFTFFFLVYSFFKVNILLEYSMLSQESMAQFGYEWDENLSLLFSLLLGVWNYKVIRGYENRLEKLPYGEVVKKTRWLKRSYSLLVTLCLLWAFVILSLKINGGHYGHMPYYPLWILFLLFYYGYCYYGNLHLRQLALRRSQKTESLEPMAHNFKPMGLEQLFSLEELEGEKANLYGTTAILGYFATSLFNKNNAPDVLWDIVANCISKLDLEDCVIYLVDRDKDKLLQKAAFGNKHHGHRKILSPLEIPFGTGIVGNVAQKRHPQLINDLSKDPRYIEDDLPRKSELAVPIMHQSTLYGVLDSEHSQKDFFQDKHLYLFQLIAKLTAIKLANIAKNPGLTLTNDNAYYKELVRFLEKERVYRNPELSLTSMATKLDISATYLSQLVNQLSGHNFSDLINRYRVQEAAHMLKNPDFSGYTILGIGLEAGFNSKSAFYSAFKKHTGSTPSRYREEMLGLSKTHLFQ